MIFTIFEATARDFTGVSPLFESASEKDGPFQKGYFPFLSHETHLEVEPLS